MKLAQNGRITIQSVKVAVHPNLIRAGAMVLLLWEETHGPKVAFLSVKLAQKGCKTIQSVKVRVHQLVK